MSADNTLETTISTALSIAALFAALAAGSVAYNGSSRVTPILVYDKDAIADQSAAYIAAGQDPLRVIDAAVELAVSSGYVVIGADTDVLAPQSALLRLDQFVEVGGEIGRAPASLDLNLPGTRPLPSKEPVPAPGQATGAAISPESDVRDVAQSLEGVFSGFTPAPKE